MPAARCERATVCQIVIAVLLAVWLVADVYGRAVWRPERPSRHHTDWTIYTAASLALRDGADPYTAASPRGWYYNYAPLFALLVTPLAMLRPEHGAAIWYVLQCAMGFGIYHLLRRLTQQCRVMQVPWWLVTAALLAGFLAALEGLQRCNVNVAIACCLLGGYVLTRIGASRVAVLTGGLLLAMAVATKLTPLLPALVAVALTAREAGGVVSGRWAWSAGGLAAGLLLFFLLLPAAVIGWRTNADLLGRWYHRVLTNPNVGEDTATGVSSWRNQSFSHAAAQFRHGWLKLTGREGGTWWQGDNDRAMRPGLGVRLVRLAVLALLLLAVVRAPAEDGVYHGALFGLACLATAAFSPLAWVHHYTFAVAAYYFVPLWHLQRGRVTTALALATAPWLLIALHFAGLSCFGVLGLGMVTWLMVSLAQLIRLGASSGTGSHRECCAGQ